MHAIARTNSNERSIFKLMDSAGYLAATAQQRVTQGKTIEGPREDLESYPPGRLEKDLEYGRCTA